MKFKYRVVVKKIQEYEVYLDAYNTEDAKEKAIIKTCKDNGHLFESGSSITTDVVKIYTP